MKIADRNAQNHHKIPKKFILGVVQNRGCIPKNNPCNYISVITIRTRPCVPVFVSVKLKICSLSISFVVQVALSSVTITASVMDSRVQLLIPKK